MELQVKGDWSHRFRTALVSDEKAAVEEAKHFHARLRNNMRAYVKDIESNLPQNYRSRPRVDYFADREEVFPDIEPGYYALGLALAIYIREEGPTDELEKIGAEFPRVYEVANYFVDNFNSRTRYERRERTEGTLVICDMPSNRVPDSELLLPLKKALVREKPELVMRGLTKAFLVSNTRYQEKSSEAVARASSDVTAMMVDDDFSPPGYEPDFKRELMHPLDSMFHALAKSSNSVASIRNAAGRAIKRCEDGADPREATRRSVEEEAADLDFGDLETLEEVAKATRIAQKYALNYLIYLGIIDESRAEEHFFWSSEPELFQGDGFEGSLHLEHIVEGLEALERKAVAHDRREAQILVRMARDFKRMIEDLEEEVALVNSIESDVLREKRKVEDVAERLKEDFSSKNITSPGNLEALRNTNTDVFRHILDQYFKMVHYCYRVNADILKVLEQIHGEEKQARRIIEEHGYREVEEIDYLIKMTEEDFRRVRRGQEVLGKVRDYLEKERKKINN